LIYDYADNAGGTADNSFYVTILKWGLDLYTESNKQPVSSRDQNKIDTLKADCQSLITDMANNARDLSAKAAEVKAAFQAFLEIVREDEKAIKETQTTVITQLGGATGAIAAMTERLAKLRTDLNNQQAEYDQGKSSSTDSGSSNTLTSLL
jgi:hypothetical protein